MHAHGAARIAGAPSSARRSLRSAFDRRAPSRIDPTARRPDACRASEVGFWDGHDAPGLGARVDVEFLLDASNRPSRDAPWALMGRSVHEHHVTLTKEQQDELALGSVADASGVPLDNLGQPRAPGASFPAGATPRARRNQTHRARPARPGPTPSPPPCSASSDCSRTRTPPRFARRVPLFRPEDRPRPKRRRRVPTRLRPRRSTSRGRGRHPRRGPRNSYLATDEEVRDAARRAETIREPPRPRRQTVRRKTRVLTTPSGRAPGARRPPRDRGGARLRGRGRGRGRVRPGGVARGWVARGGFGARCRRVAADCDVDRLLTISEHPGHGRPGAVRGSTTGVPG